MPKTLPSFRHLYAGLVFLPVCATSPAQAHVKWFAIYNVNESPNAITGIGNGTILVLVVFALVLLWGATRLEQSNLAMRLRLMLTRTADRLNGRMEDFLRATTAAFFVSLWATGGIILTPELKTSSAWVSLLQLTI